MVQRFAAGLGSFEGDGELLFGFGLADELAQPARAQLEFETLLFVGARGADQTFGRVVASDDHAEEKFSSSQARGANCSRVKRLPIRASASRDRAGTDAAALNDRKKFRSQKLRLWAGAGGFTFGNAAFFFELEIRSAITFVTSD